MDDKIWPVQGGPPFALTQASTPCARCRSAYRVSGRQKAQACTRPACEVMKLPGCRPVNFVDNHNDLLFHVQGLAQHEACLRHRALNGVH